MKLAYPVATPDTADPGMLALRGAPAESFRLLQSLGYRAAELMVRDPSQLSSAAILGQASDWGLKLPAVSTGQLRKEDKLSLCDLDAKGRRCAVDRTKRVIDFAAELGAQVNIGTLRGPLPEDRPAALAAARASFQELLSHADANDVRLAVEPQCRYVINWLNTVKEALDWAGAFEGERLWILFDFYHALLEERSVHAALIRAFRSVSWVQVSDSNRRAPGAGQTNFGESIRILKALDYEGYVSVECLQVPDSRTAAAAAAAHLLPYLEEA